MKQLKLSWFGLGFVLFTSLACGSFFTAEPTLAPPPTLSLFTFTPPPPIVGTLDPNATLPPGVTIPATVGANTPSVKSLVNVNIRNGPGTAYNIIGLLAAGNTAVVVGKSPDGSWWKILCPAGGNECWVSADANLTSASNAAGVPIAAVPPTPIPSPTPLATNTSVPTNTPPPVPAPDGVAAIAYIQDGHVWVQRVTRNGSFVGPDGNATQITQNKTVTNLYYAPDGRRIAFVYASGQNNILAVINRDGTGERDLVKSADLPALTGDKSGLVRLVGQVQWLNDSQTLAFNTRGVNPSGPGVAEGEDLWTVDLNGNRQTRLDVGLGGGRFYVTSDNLVLFTKTNGVGKAKIDGSQRQISATFDPVITYSEGAFYPTLLWSNATRSALLTVPSADPLAANPSVSLWTIDKDGVASITGRVEGISLFSSTMWSPAGDKVAYVRQKSGQNRWQLFLNDRTGRAEAAYGVEGDNQLFLHSWNPTSTLFLYSALTGNQQQHFLGVVNGQPLGLPLANDTAVLQTEWLNDQLALVAVKESGGTSIYLVNNQAQASTLIFSPAQWLSFDFWIP